jgi:hypothetical protein
MTANDVKSLKFCEAATASRVRNGSERLSLDGWTEETVEEKGEEEGEDEGEEECKECECSSRREGLRHCVWWTVLRKWRKCSERDLQDDCLSFFLRKLEGEATKQSHSKESGCTFPVAI